MHDTTVHAAALGVHGYGLICVLWTHREKPASDDTAALGVHGYGLICVLWTRREKPAPDDTAALGVHGYELIDVHPTSYCG